MRPAGMRHALERQPRSVLGSRPNSVSIGDLNDPRFSSQAARRTPILLTPRNRRSGQSGLLLS
jgi:hypothetical protein